MEKKLFRFCAFADEADGRTDGQIAALQENGIDCLEARGVDGRNIADLRADDAKALRARLDAAGITLWSLGSPAGKTKITDDFSFEEERFKRLLETADITGASCIRLFSFYGTDGKDEYFDEVCARLSRFIELAKGHGVKLCHENEKGIYGDVADRCVKLHRALPELHAVYDPANYLQCGENTLEAWEKIAPFLTYMHIKDCAPGGTVVPPGEGEGYLPELLADYGRRGGGVVTLEPHLNDFIGLSALEAEGERSVVNAKRFANGRAAFDYAVGALRKMTTVIEKQNQ